MNYEIKNIYKRNLFLTEKPPPHTTRPINVLQVCLHRNDFPAIMKNARNES